jgi:hypothetical protein
MTKYQFDREQLDTLTRGRIKKVNDEAGYRQYLEVPEMVEIVASIIEQSPQLISKQTDKEAILCLTKEIEELQAKLAAWEKCADDLVDYAHDVLNHISSWGKGYNRYDKEIMRVEDAIEAHLKLKNANKSDE